MHPRTAAFGDRLRHEGQDDAVFQRDLARHQPEQHDVVDRLHRIVEGQRVFELRRVVLRRDHLDRKAQLVGHFPDPVVEPQRIGEGAGAVDHAARAVIGHQAAVLVGDQRIGFQFDADLRRQPLFLPVGDGPFQRAARAQFQRLAGIVVKVADDDLGVGVPRIADIVMAPFQLHVRQALHHHRARRVEQVAVVMHAEGRAAEPGRLSSPIFEFGRYLPRMMLR
jgi:hypothetical protein